MLDALGRVIGRHPWWVCVTWLAAVLLAVASAVGGVFGQSLFDRLTTGVVTVPGDSATGYERLLATADTGPVVLLVLDRTGVDSTPMQEALDAARTDLSALDGVQRIDDPFAAGNGLYDEDSLPYVSDDFNAVLMSVELRRGLTPERSDELIAEVSQRLERVQAAVPGSVALVGGVETVIDQVTDQVEEDLRTGEGIALPLSLLIMIFVFGGFLAAGMPIIGALASIAGALATLLAFSYAIELDASTVNVVTVLGLGLCIDYGLLLVSRYREEARRLHDGAGGRLSADEHDRVLRLTLRTAGRTVLYSGVTVAISLTGLLAFRADVLRAIGAAGVSVVVVALLVALTLVPALLTIGRHRITRPGLVARVPLLGRLVRRLGDVSPDEGAFSRLARGVQAHPALVITGVLGVLLVCTLPLARLTPVSSGVELLPQQAEQRQLFETLDTRFRFAGTPLIQVVTEAPVEAVGPLVQEISTLPVVLFVDPPTAQGDDERGRATVINVRIANAYSSETAQRTVASIRGMDPGYRIWVTGPTAALVDYVDDLTDRAPIAIGVVVLATFVLLFLMTGSVLIPLKALLMNVVSLGACLGVLVWGFQDGGLEGLLAFRSPGGIETLVLALTVAFGFGLAMDYEVFLLSRIAEYRRQGHTNDEAVVMGLQRSGRIITSAALIIVVVFSGFVAGQLLVIKETGVALAAAVFIDATLIRMLLVPATMTLLGDWNWWAPAPLARLHARIGLRDH